ncbi:MAG: GIY-YIG nuclease family protein, partial [Candidatus Magasanikbacteria bacterium]|nr:GIY-YIG nuclease family protein [Candidatus Magasanikbacteria bacterium]
TNNLDRRVLEHKHDIHDDSFSKRYQIHRLVYYEIYTDIREAIKREKQLKKWNRDWKIRLIEENNKDWFDLSSGSPLEFIPIESGRG